MNEKAMKLKLFSTNFSNPHGLQNAMNMSSAKDMLKLAEYCSKNSLFREVMSCEYHRFELYKEEDGTGRELGRWWNTNKLLGKGWEGVKTGQTTAAGACLASLKGDILIVVLNCGDAEKRFSETERIYEWYINQKAAKGIK